MAPTQITRIEGTPEQLIAWLERLPSEKRYRITVEEPEAVPAPAKKPSPRRVSAMGKYTFVPGGSEEFAREKQAEIEREDRPL